MVSHGIFLARVSSLTQQRMRKCRKTGEHKVNIYCQMENKIGKTCALKKKLVKCTKHVIIYIYIKWYNWIDISYTRILLPFQRLLPFKYWKDNNSNLFVPLYMCNAKWALWYHECVQMGTSMMNSKYESCILWHFYLSQTTIVVLWSWNVKLEYEKLKEAKYSLV